MENGSFEDSPSAANQSGNDLHNYYNTRILRRSSRPSVRLLPWIKPHHWTIDFRENFQITTKILGLPCLNSISLSVTGQNRHRSPLAPGGGDSARSQAISHSPCIRYQMKIKTAVWSKSDMVAAEPSCLCTTSCLLPHRSSHSPDSPLLLPSALPQSLLLLSLAECPVRCGQANSW